MSKITAPDDAALKARSKYAFITPECGAPKTMPCVTGLEAKA
jgi:hypothetical protein